MARRFLLVGLLSIFEPIGSVMQLVFANLFCTAFKRVATLGAPPPPAAAPGGAADGGEEGGPPLHALFGPYIPLFVCWYCQPRVLDARFVSTLRRVLRPDVA